MCTTRVITFGELLVDELPSGPLAGGGPFNTTAHLLQLGVAAAQISAVGQDAYAHLLLDAVHEQGLSSDLIQENAHPTGNVQVSLSASGEAQYTIVDEVAWDYVTHVPTEHVSTTQLSLTAKQLASAEVLAVWLLGLRSAVSFETFKWAKYNCSPTCLIAADLGLRPGNFSAERIDELLHLVRVVKLNAEELDQLSRLLGLASGPAVLAKAYDLDTVVTTLGERGAESYRDGITTRVDAEPATNVIDTVGCGDAFFAGYLAARLRDASEQECLTEGCQRGTFATSYAGGLPPAPAA